MSSPFWWSTSGGDVQLPAVEPSYEVKESLRFDGEDNNMSRTPTDTDGQRVGETGPIEEVIYNEDGTVTIKVADGLEPHQSLDGGYLQEGDTLTQDNAGAISTSGITAVSDVPYLVGNSVIFDAAQQTYLTRTPGYKGDRTRWTWSGWIKVSELDAGQSVFFGAKGTSGNANVSLDYNSDSLRIVFWNGSGSDAMLSTKARFRDTAKWQHVVFAVDTTQAVASDRVKIYVNGTRISEFDTETYPTLNYETYVNEVREHTIGRNVGNQSAYYRGYLAEVQFIDGHAHTADTFGEYNSIGIWSPKAVDLTRRDPYSYRANTDQVWSGTLLLTEAIRLINQKQKRLTVI